MTHPGSLGIRADRTVAHARVSTDQGAYSRNLHGAIVQCGIFVRVVSKGALKSGSVGASFIRRALLWSASINLVYAVARVKA